MRVLQIGPYARPHGGVQANLVAMREFLRQREIPCAVINLTRFRDAEEDEVFYPRSAIGLVWQLLRRRYDVIHLHVGGNLTGRLLALGVLCSMIPWSKTILTFHSGGYPSSKAGQRSRRRSLKGFAVRRFDRVIAVNPEIQNFFRRLGCLRDRTRVIYPHAFRASIANGEGMSRDQLPPPLREFWQAHDPVLLCVGQLEREYDIPLQIAAVEEVRERYPDAGLAVIGTGSLEAELRERVRATRYADHILLCGDIPHESTIRAIALSDVLLRTTLYDGDSIAVREALHLGTPVIATDNGMRPPGVQLIPIGDPVALQDTLRQVLGRETKAPRSYEPDERNLEEVLWVYRELTA